MKGPSDRLAAHSPRVGYGRLRWHVRAYCNSAFRSKIFCCREHSIAAHDQAGAREQRTTVARHFSSTSCAPSSLQVSSCGARIRHENGSAVVSSICDDLLRLERLGLLIRNVGDHKRQHIVFWTECRAIRVGKRAEFFQIFGNERHYLRLRNDALRHQRRIFVRGIIHNIRL